ncbi:MAG: glycoside hydrolase family 2 protein [Eubacteriales bacterium]|nr:glycoside hydrolase family 2 protein [Eubacteriales bacterium]
MKKQFLRENWEMRQVGKEAFLTAKVPGSVYGDLLANREMEDPFWKDNEIEACALMEKDYEYVERFDCEEGILDSDRVVLRFDGLDTVADVSLNGVHLGSPLNMHRIWEYDVKEILQESGNELQVVLHSPNKWIREAFQKCRTMGNDDTFEGFMHLRKAHYMFGWDWGAHLPDAGIFRPVSLLGIDGGRIDSVYITQEHERTGELEEGTVRPVVKSVTLTFKVMEETAGAAGGGPKLTDVTGGRVCERCGGRISYTVAVTAPDGTVEVREDSPETIRIENPKLWWPNGYGEQNLYGIRVTLFLDGKEIDSWERRIGLRTMTMHREKDEWGECFAHEVNGVTVFAMGADYIPEDNLLGRVTPETTRTLLEKAKFANYNSIRVWGGGYYPSDWFYDICDEMGFMVWQDFMFACSVYELTPEFEANIRQEFIENVKRIRHHASLGLWCGNNEMEMFVGNHNEWVTKHSEVRDYLFMYERIIPEILREYDPQTFYWPASPSSGGSFDFPNDPNRGDQHYWEVWHGNKPFAEYRKYFFRYASEFGFQAFPAVKTIETFTDDPADMNPFSYVMEKHERQYGACGKIMGYMQQTYKYPNSFPTFVYASQLLQADGIRYGVEHFRRNRGRCMGAVYWQFNDCWPVISWASVDYSGRMKALHYYAKRFFAPIMLSCEEHGMMDVEANMNREHFEDLEKSIRLNATNETVEDVDVTVRWALRNPKAEILDGGEEMLHVPALTSRWLDKKDFPEVDIFSHYVSYELEKDGEVISSGTVNFSYPKYFKYEDPCLTCRMEGDEIVVSAAAYAKSVEIQNENEDLVLSDNYFDLNAEEKRVRILSGSTENLRLRSVYDIK